MSEIQVTLISGRSIGQGTSLEGGKTSENYRQKVAIVELNKSDMNELGVSEGDPVQVRTPHGSIVVTCQPSDSVDPGICFIPYGPWVTQTISSHTEGIGMPSFKGIKVYISPAKDKKVLSVNELIGKLEENHGN